MSQVQALKALYSAIQRGDTAAVTAALADDVAWEHGTRSHKVPWVPFRHGRSDVVDALQSAHADPSSSFEPTTFFAVGQRVTARVAFVMRVPPTAPGEEREITWQEVHQWQFDEQGLITHLRQRSDMAGPPETAARVLPFERLQHAAPKA